MANNDIHQFELFDLLAVILKQQNLNYLSSVGGGGINQFLGHLQENEVQTSNSSSELDGISRAIGYQRTLKEGGWAGAYSTHGVGVAQWAGPQLYNSIESRLPLLSIIGANVDGQTGPMHFQRFDPNVQLPQGHTIFEIKVVDGKLFPNNLANNLLNVLDNAYTRAGSVILSVPNNMATFKVDVAEKDFIRLLEPPVIQPAELSAEARQQLNALHAKINKPESKILSIAGDDLLHTMRMHGKDKVFGSYNELTDKMVCNRATNADCADMLTGHEHELVVASHNFDPKVFNAMKKSNIVIGFGTGPNATITGIGGVGVSYFQNTDLTIIHSDKRLLEEWKKDFPKATVIHADLSTALEYMNGKEYDHTYARALHAKQVAADLRKAVNEEDIEIPGAQKMRSIQMAVASTLARHDKVGITVCSGDTPNQFLRYRTKHEGPGSVFYPSQGMLGVVPGATYGFADSGQFNKVVMMIGDGGMGYSIGELPELAKLAKEKQIPIVGLIYNNQVFGSVGKGIEVGAQKREAVKANMHQQNQKAAISFAKLVDAMPEYEARGIEIDGKDPSKIAAELEKALNYKGLSIIEVNVRNIEHSLRK